MILSLVFSSENKTISKQDLSKDPFEDRVFDWLIILEIFLKNSSECEHFQTETVNQYLQFVKNFKL
jgi:hypothetical protein